MYNHLLLVAACTFGIGHVLAQQDPRINVALTLETPSTGVSTTPDGRLFILLSHVDGSTGPQVVEWDYSTSTYSPYPNAEWNAYNSSGNYTLDPATHLVRVNSQRIGPDGALWLVDTGSPGFGSPVIFPNGPKLVQVNLTTNTVQRVYPMGNALRSTSLLDDVRFNPAANTAYLTDAGAPALIILDLLTGALVRVLDNSPSTSAYMPTSARGTLLHGPYPATSLLYLYADQLEVSPDSTFLYFQPTSGGMSRIPTSYLDASITNSSLALLLDDYVTPFAQTPSTGGTAIDANGSIYVSDLDRSQILKVSPNGTTSVLVTDERLGWVDAMWVSSQGVLWMPAPQLDLGVPFQGGVDRVPKPVFVFTIDLGVGPSGIDHA